VTIRITPSEAPFRAEVLHGSVVWPEQGATYVAGTVINGLTFRLYDQAGKEMAIDSNPFKVRVETAGEWY